MIEKYRKMYGITQEHLAERLHISTRQLQRIENKESNPSIAVLKDIISVLNMSDTDIAKLIKEDLKG